jgi:Flp pilus assembly protein TadD
MWFALGLCYYRIGNIPKAKLSFDKTLELDQNNSMALASLGIIEMVMG